MTVELTWRQEQTVLREALKRIPDGLKMFSFFSGLDLWNYEVVMDNRLCDDCLQHEDATYLGSNLRLLFPNLKIKTQGLIVPNVHPHCRCQLHWAESAEGRRAKW